MWFCRREPRRWIELNVREAECKSDVTTLGVYAREKCSQWVGYIWFPRFMDVVAVDTVVVVKTVSCVILI